jgi:hypothetical protein
MNKAEEVAYHYYNGQVPDISELRVISETPEFNLATVRWKESKVTITVKAHFGETLSIVELK